MRSSALRVLALLMLPGLVSAASFTGLGDLAGGDFESYAEDISADGSVVVGQGYSAYGPNGGEAFRWTRTGGMVGLGSLRSGPYFTSSARSVSADGGTVVGWSSSASGWTAVRWTEAGISNIGGLGGATGSYALDVSSDGAVIVGQSDYSQSASEAFRWAPDSGVVGLGYLPGSATAFSTAYGVSSDGSVIVGYGNTATSFEAFRWTATGGMVGLGQLLGGLDESVALDVSADGSVVVGHGRSISGLTEAFRWTQNGGIVGLGTLGGTGSSEAYAVSADGSVVVGYNSSPGKMEAFRWTQAGGIEPLFDALVAGGADGLLGWQLRAATGVSADGLTVVGWGVNPQGKTEGFIATLAPVPIPPAVWLFGSALGLMGVTRRKKVL